MVSDRGQTKSIQQSHPSVTSKVKLAKLSVREVHGKWEAMGSQTNALESTETGIKKIRD